MFKFLKPKSYELVVVYTDGEQKGFSNVSRLRRTTNDFLCFINNETGNTVVINIDKLYAYNFKENK